MIKVSVLGTVFRKEKFGNMTKLIVNSSTKRKDKNTGEHKWINEYIDLVIFNGPTKDFIERYIHEGNAIFVEAEQSTYEREVDGETKKSKSWVIRQCNFAPKNKTKSDEFNDKLKNNTNQEDEDDLLPF